MTASVDPTVDRLARAIDGLVYSGGRNGPVIAAMGVLGDHEIRTALAAADVVAELDRRHQWRTWADGISKTCSCGRGDCDVRELLDRALP